MASEKVIQSLEALHRELDKLSPAIEHVKTAQKIAETIKDIPQRHLDLINSIEKTDENFKKELKEQLKVEASKISDEVNHIIKGLKETEKFLKSEIVDLEKLKKIISDFHVDLVRINFPERLDKVDANISGIMAAIQAVQSRVDSLERNITDRLKDQADFQKETKLELFKELNANTITLNNSIEKIAREIVGNQHKGAKKHQTNTYITWAIIIAATIAIVLLK